MSSSLVFGFNTLAGAGEVLVVARDVADTPTAGLVIARLDLGNAAIDLLWPTDMSWSLLVDGALGGGGEVADAGAALFLLVKFLGWGAGSVRVALDEEAASTDIFPSSSSFEIFG